MTSLRSLGLEYLAKTSPFKNYEKVGDWLPSNKPRFKHRLTREVVTLWKLEGDTVWYMKSCGKLKKTTRGAFAAQFFRVG